MSWTIDRKPIPHHLTIEGLTQVIELLEAQEPVFKVDVDALRSDLSRGFDMACDRNIKSEYHHAGKWKELSEDEKIVYDALPYEIRHWFGKKFSGILIRAPLSEYCEAVRSHRNRWRPLFKRTQALIARQTKGRKPRPVDPDQEMRDQERAMCSCCFRDVAVNAAGIIHDHGFDISHGFRNGTCDGAGIAHFGTEAGRDNTAKYMVLYREQAERTRGFVEEMRNGTKTPVVRDYKGKPVLNPSENQIAAAIDATAHQAVAADRAADFMEGQVKEWTPRDPRTVKVPAQ